jgi:hypothetical protein
MTGLPTSLAIGIWFTGSFCLVAVLAYAFDAPSELVYATFIVGLIVALAEWLVHQRKR